MGVRIHGIGADISSFTLGLGMPQSSPSRMLDVGIAVMIGDLDAVLGSVSYQF